MRPAGKARRARIPGVFERGATQPAGMQRRPNAAGVSPRAASLFAEVPMRIWSTVLMAVLLPAAGRAQAFQFRSPAPEVTAATAVWQVSSQPIIVQGLVYLPTRDYRLFDGQVMTQVGIYQGVPIYADTTLEV